MSAALQDLQRDLNGLSTAVQRLIAERDRLQKAIDNVGDTIHSAIINYDLGELVDRLGNDAIGELADHIAVAIVDTTKVGWFDGVPRPMGVETAEGKR